MNASDCFLTRRFRTPSHFYTLKMYETDGTDIAYRLTQDGKDLFKGRQYRVGAGTCADSDDSVRGLMGFLTLRPGDTDREYFDNYTPEQMAFAEGDAEYLQHAVWERYGED